MKLKRWDSDIAIFEADVSSLKELLELALKTGISLYRVNLRGADLRSTNLIGANLKNADLSSADLRYADLRYADLSYADLKNTDLRAVNLRSADLSYSILRYANLEEVNLKDANLRGTNLEGTNLKKVYNYYSFVAYDTSKRLVHCIKHMDTWMLKEDNFWGTLDELEKEVEETHNSKVYLSNIAILKEL